MLASVNDLHLLELGGRRYWLRTPDVYDGPKIRRVLTRQRLRRPELIEFRLAALAGIAAMAAATGEAAEGESQSAAIEEWYQLLEPLDEDAIDEPDFEARAAELARRQAERRARQQALLPTVAAVEANLERHWQPYAELKADREYFDDVSRIDAVRLLLVRIGANGTGGGVLPRDEHGMLDQAAYLAIPRGDRAALATFAFGLLAPDETQRKN